MFLLSWNYAENADQHCEIFSGVLESYGGNLVTCQMQLPSKSHIDMMEHKWTLKWIVPRSEYAKFFQFLEDHNTILDSSWSCYPQEDNIVFHATFIVLR